MKIIAEYQLSSDDAATLNQRPQAALVDLIVEKVREEVGLTVRARSDIDRSRQR